MECDRFQDNILRERRWASASREICQVFVRLHPLSPASRSSYMAVHKMGNGTCRDTILMEHDDLEPALNTAACGKHQIVGDAQVTSQSRYQALEFFLLRREEPEAIF